MYVADYFSVIILNYYLYNYFKDWCPVVYSKYAGTEVEFNGSNHLILKEDDIVGILETEDVTDLKPIDDKVPIKVSNPCTLFS